MVVLVLVAALVLVAIVLKLTNPLPDQDKNADFVAVAAGAGDLADRVHRIAALHPGQTGVRLYPEAIDSFAARLAMVRDAQRTIDAQYYIWHDDVSGRMLLQEMIAAADRGVRVRLLIDDNPTAGLDGLWSAANAHPNIAVRLFNPLVIRPFRPANYLFDFPRLNRRMHNKSLTVDGTATILGGRNIGDEYFGATSEGLFIDLDAILIGAAVDDVASDFERYWTSESAYPAATILPPSTPHEVAALRQPSPTDNAQAAAYRQASQNAVEQINWGDGEAGWTWAAVQLFSDDPAKALGQAEASSLLITGIVPIIQAAKTRLDLVSGYFVPTRDGSELLQELPRRGVTTRIVTNSIQVTDVPIVNAGYAPYRKPLLASGVQLFEARPLSDGVEARVKVAATSFSGGGESVHAKAFAIDDRQLFIGSFNFDPRSALLNCEMGVLIDAPELATLFREALDQRLPDVAYRLSLDADDRLLWRSQTQDGEQVATVEPGTTAFQRGLLKVLSWLPVEWLL
jgi:putative cardiolipin synthase